MALGAALVDRARLVAQQSSGKKVEGTTRYHTVYGPWFKVRLEMDQAQDVGLGNVSAFQPGERPRTVRRPTLMTGNKDSEGNTLTFGAHDRMEVDSAELGRGIWEITSEPKPMRKKRGILGWEATLARVEDHDGVGAL